MNYYIKAVEYFLPEKILDNDSLSKKWNISSGFIESRVGIKNRHISAENEPTSELAFNAVCKIFKSGVIAKEEIDILIVCTQNPDYRLPMVSSLLHRKLELKKDCICFDINLGCSGFVYSLPIAGNFLKLNLVKNAILVMADEYSKIIDYEDKNTAALFGDAASAILISQCEDGKGVIDYKLYSNGKSAQSLIAYNSGVLIDESKRGFLSMNGREIYKFSTTEVPASITEILDRSNIKVDEVKYFILHQANMFMLQEIRDKIGIRKEQFIIDMEEYGNTVSSTIPIAYKNLIEKKVLKSGDLIVFCGFGVGLSWGTVLYKY